MRYVERFLLATATLFSLSVGGAILTGATPAAPQGEDELVQRGRYLVHDVAMCVQCHSPRNERGELERLHLLGGGRIPLASPYPGKPWAAAAPHIAGLPGFDPEDVVLLLMTGHRADGRSPRPPMPPFRFEREDATAIVAYLRSIE